MELVARGRWRRRQSAVLLQEGGHQIAQNLPLWPRPDLVEILQHLKTILALYFADGVDRDLRHQAARHDRDAVYESRLSVRRWRNEPILKFQVLTFEVVLDFHNLVWRIEGDPKLKHGPPPHLLPLQ